MLRRGSAAPRPDVRQGRATQLICLPPMRADDDAAFAASIDDACGSAFISRPMFEHRPRAWRRG
jgi:hypothetical protein